MKALIYFFHALEGNIRPYRAALSEKGIESEIIPIAAIGYSSVYTEMARKDLAGYSSQIDGLLSSHVPDELDPRDDPSVALVLASWSAGYGYIREAIRHERDANRVDGIVLIDSWYGSLDRDKKVVRQPLETLERYAHRAKDEQGVTVLWDGYADVPTTYASTQQIAEALTDMVGGEGGGFRTGFFDTGKGSIRNHIAAMLEWGPGWLSGALEQLRARRDVLAIETSPGNTDPPESNTRPRPTIRMGARGSAVELWQEHLVGLGYDLGSWGADGIFGPATRAATIRYQISLGLDNDGIVGPRTWGSMDTERISQPTPTMPDLPEPEHQLMEQLYGVIEHEPVGDKNGSIEITNDWARESIVRITIPELRGIPGYHTDGAVLCHRLAAAPIAALWRAWAEDNLLEHVMTFDGLYNPRYVRGSKRALSEHAWGAAFDINARWNPYRFEPARAGSTGSVIPLVRAANQRGFWWRGHSQPLDAMHFCLVRPRLLE